MAALKRYIVNLPFTKQMRGRIETGRIFESSIESVRYRMKDIRDDILSYFKPGSVVFLAYDGTRGGYFYPNMPRYNSFEDLWNNEHDEWLPFLDNMNDINSVTMVMPISRTELVDAFEEIIENIEKYAEIR